MNNIEKIREETKDVVLVAATKYIDCEKMRSLFNYGINNFGENRVDSFLEKKNELKDLNITWHFIGHLQKNKASKVINEIDYLHSLDSIELAKIINEKRKTPLKCFVELHLTSSITKNGVREEELDSFMDKLRQFKNINVIGFMAMSDAGFKVEETQSVFEKANHLKEKYHLSELSIGMSDDYKIALKCGATFIRLGRILYYFPF